MMARLRVPSLRTISPRARGANRRREEAECPSSSTSWVPCSLSSAAVPVAVAITPDRHVARSFPPSWAHHYRLSVNDTKVDTDRDRLTNLREYRERTNPLRKDTDRDRLADGQEVLKYKTSPRRKDTDRDGLTDFQESSQASRPTRARRTPTATATATVSRSRRAATRAARQRARARRDQRRCRSGSRCGRGGRRPDGHQPPRRPRRRRPAVAPPLPGGPTPTPIPKPPPTPQRCDRIATNSSTLSTAVLRRDGRPGHLPGVRQLRHVPRRQEGRRRLPGPTARRNAVDLARVRRGDARHHRRPDHHRRHAAQRHQGDHDPQLDFTGGLRFDALANADVLLDSNTHNNIMTCPSCDPARIHGSYESQTPSGVTVQNSLMDGGNADGIQTGVGMNIINNEIRNIRETGPSDPAHSDAMQLIAAPGVRRARQLGPRRRVRHRRLRRHRPRDDRGQRRRHPADVGHRALLRQRARSSATTRSSTDRPAAIRATRPAASSTSTASPSDPAGTGTIVQDNVTTGVTIQNGSPAATRNHNMVRQSRRHRRLQRHADLRRRRRSPTSWVGLPAGRGLTRARARPPTARTSGVR